MTRYLLFCVLFLSELSFGQTYKYIPIPSNNATWKVIDIKASGPGYTRSEVFQYSMIGQDSIVGVDTFHVLSMTGLRENSSNSAAVNLYNNAFEIPFTSIGLPWNLWVIEKEKRVYVLDSPMLDTAVHKPYLDFNYTYVGERTTGRYPTDTVISIDTIIVNGTLRKRFITSHEMYSFMPWTDTIVEGMGSVRFALGFKSLFEYGAFPGSNNPRLKCFSVNSQLEYQFNNSACTDIWPLNIKDNNLNQDKVLVSPNPFINQLVIDDIAKGDVYVFNSIGTLVYTKRFVLDKKLEIFTDNWPPGLYVVTVSTHDGNRISQKLVKY